MSNNEEKNISLTETAEEAEINEAAEAKSDDSEALESFLNRESAPKKAKKSVLSKRGRTIAIVLIACGAILILVGMIFLLKQSQKASDDDDILTEAWTIATVDEAGMHVVEVPTDGEGNPRQNGYGTLIEYNPFLISQIRVENASGIFTICAYSDESESTVYELEGYESFALKTGIPDNVANDVIDLHFLTIAGVGKNPADFGLSSPRAQIFTAYTDGTTARINVGDEAPGGAGTYISFGSGESIFLVSSESVDSFFYAPADFIDLTVTKAAASTDNDVFRRLTLSGSRYPQTIVIEPNTDEAVGYEYCVTSPSAGFADASASALIAGSIRDLMAESVVAVNADGADPAAFLAPYGLAEDAYAEVFAEYPDAAVHLRASAADEEGNVRLINLDDPRVVYQIPLDKVSWANASLDQLTPETILRVRRAAIDSITVTAGEKTCAIDVDTRTQTVETTDGGTEEVTTTEAYYNDKLLGDDSFTILLQNLVEMKNSGKTDAPTNTPLFEVCYAYTTGRADDTVVIYDSDGKTCAVALNGIVIGSVAKTYAASLVENVSDIIAGKVPKSL